MIIVTHRGAEPGQRHAKNTSLLAWPFAAELYQAITFGHSVGRAVEMTRAALELHGIHRPEIVQLLHRDGVDPNHVFVIPSRLRQPMNRAPEKPNEIPVITRSSKRRFVAVVSGWDDSVDGVIGKTALGEHRGRSDPVDHGDPR